MDQAEKAEALRKLHHGPELLVLPNAWDVASAKLFEKMGYPAIATTSAGVVASLGWKDHEEIPPDEMFAAVARIAAAVDVPVSADIEAGYGLEPAELVERLVATSAVGCNLEDSDHHGKNVLVSAEAQAERLAAFAEASARAGVPVVLNARIDVHIREYGPEEGRLEEAIRRGRLYRESGADCLYPIGVTDEDTISALVDGFEAPVNTWYRPDGPSLSRLAELGVRRVTFAGGLARMALARVEEWLASLKS
jgi:2-methylisocitrate lyase-like PEP mutase family enzyme